jgi:hypothetical protein
MYAFPASQVKMYASFEKRLAGVLSAFGGVYFALGGIYFFQLHGLSVEHSMAAINKSAKVLWSPA